MSVCRHELGGGSTHLPLDNSNHASNSLILWGGDRHLFRI